VFCRPGEEDQLPSYTLTFNIEFPHDNDQVYLAHCYPYTYTDLQDYLIQLQVSLCIFLLIIIVIYVSSPYSVSTAAFNQKKALFTSKMDLELRNELVKYYIWSIALYGAETGTVRGVDQK
jgi:hypothetical protein